MNGIADKRKKFAESIRSQSRQSIIESSRKQYRQDQQKFLTMQRRALQGGIKIMRVVIIKELENNIQNINANQIKVSRTGLQIQLQNGKKFDVQCVIKDRKRLGRELQLVALIVITNNPIFVFYGQSNTGKSTAMSALMDNVSQRLLIEDTVQIKSYEVYLGQIYDITDGNKVKCSKINKKDEGKIIKSTQEMRRFMERMNKIKVVRDNFINKSSSRSHIVYLIKSESKKMVCIDLAGRQKQDDKWSDELKKEYLHNKVESSNFVTLIKTMNMDLPYNGKKDVLVGFIKYLVKYQEYKLVTVTTIDRKQYLISKASLQFMLQMPKQLEKNISKAKSLAKNNKDRIDEERRMREEQLERQRKRIQDDLYS